MDFQMGKSGGRVKPDSANRRVPPARGACRPGGVGADSIGAGIAFPFLIKGRLRLRPAAEGPAERAGRDDMRRATIERNTQETRIAATVDLRSEEHTSELQSLMRTSN